MANGTDDIGSRLLATFRVEAQEHLQAITAGLAALADGPPARDAEQVLETLFREVHTLKGAARSVGIRDVETVCQATESLLGQLTRGVCPLTGEVGERLRGSVDVVARLLSGTADPAAVEAAVARLERSGPAPRATPSPPAPGPAAARPAPRAEPAPAPAADTIRIPIARLDALLFKTEDLLGAKLAAAERVRDARALAEAVGTARAAAARSGTNGAPHASPDGEPAAALQRLERQGQALAAALAVDARTLARGTDELDEALRGLRMVPAATVLDLFPLMVRDLAGERGKEIEWTSSGGHLDIDRKVLDAIKEPLIHLVRNAVDHGIEPPAARQRAGKPARGRVSIAVTPAEEGRIAIEVRDDGAGIDPARLRASAVRGGFLTAAEAEQLSEADAVDLIYRSGLSTSAIITTVSGRGLGLPIVREQVERLGGSVTVETRPNAGTTVRLEVPASIATFQGLLVRAGEQPFLLPLGAVERVVRLAPADVHRIEGRESVTWNGEALLVARLGEVLGVGTSSTSPASPFEKGGPRGIFSNDSVSKSPHAPLFQRGESEARLAAIVRASGERIALVVDDVLGAREVVVKQFAAPLVRVRNVAAAGLLGSGDLVLILRPGDLVASARRAERDSPAHEKGTVPLPERLPAILVVDDSITTRMMEKNLLEAAGYTVRVAADGVEAWTALKCEAFDLVVSDVDMPRMDGFELTRRIRTSQEHAALPVVLVTALESREHKERGIEVGANAYVVKSSFDQSNLLEIIHRLV